jgi:hypothetical protein
MFGLTKHQFLKKSKKSLDEISTQILSFRNLRNQVNKGTISTIEAQRVLDKIRRDVEDTFSLYEKLNPPSKCTPLKQKIFNATITFHGSMVSYSEYLTAKDKELAQTAKEKYVKSDEELKEFLDMSMPLSRQLDQYLQKK